MWRIWLVRSPRWTLRTGPQGKQWVLFPRDPQCFPRRGRGKHWGRGETKLSVFRGTSHVVFCYTSQSKLEKNCEEIVCFTPADPQICRGFKGELITCESKVHMLLFPRELVSFVRPGELLLCFDPRYVMRFLLMGKRVWVGRYDNRVCGIAVFFMRYFDNWNFNMRDILW